MIRLVARIVGRLAPEAECVGNLFEVVVRSGLGGGKLVLLKARAARICEACRRSSAADAAPVLGGPQTWEGDTGRRRRSVEPPPRQSNDHTLRVEVASGM